MFEIILENNNIKNILELAGDLNMPNWYLGAGCVAQTVWNIFHDFEPERNIKDYDLVYFDAKNISYEAENFYIKKAESIFSGLAEKIDIKNQARVHLWYEERFGKKIAPYFSAEEAIDTWPTTATTVGIRLEDGKPVVYSSFGLKDLMNMIVRPNKKLITECVYDSKIERWLKNWPKLKIIPWEREQLKV